MDFIVTIIIVVLIVLVLLMIILKGIRIWCEYILRIEREVAYNIKESYKRTQDEESKKIMIGELFENKRRFVFEDFGRTQKISRDEINKYLNRSDCGE